MTPTRDRATIGTALIGLLALAALFRTPEPVDHRVVRFQGVPREGWYEADDFAAAARSAGASAPVLASATPTDGDTVRLLGGWALVERTPAPETTQAFGRKLSLNGATAAELEGLPGIGPALAGRIVAGRPYRSMADLDRVRGIGPAKMRALAPLVEP